MTHIIMTSTGFLIKRRGASGYLFKCQFKRQSWGCHARGQWKTDVTPFVPALTQDVEAKMSQHGTGN
jgi:hypothetical protein